MRACCTVRTVRCAIPKILTSNRLCAQYSQISFTDNMFQVSYYMEEDCRRMDDLSGHLQQLPGSAIINEQHSKPSKCKCVCNKKLKSSQLVSSLITSANEVLSFVSVCCLWAGYCKSLIFQGYYILQFFAWTLVRWNLISRILSCYNALPKRSRGI